MAWQLASGIAESSGLSALSLAEVADELLDRRQRRELLLPESCNMQPHMDPQSIRAEREPPWRRQASPEAQSTTYGSGVALLNGKQACD